MSEKIPLLLLGDDPTLPTGLARILRDLLRRVVTSPKFADQIEVAVLGFGRHGDSEMHVNGKAIPLFRMLPMERTCGEWDMHRIDKEFFKGRRPIFWPIWDAVRCLWMPTLKSTLGASLWGYFPFDSHSKDGLQPKCVLDVLAKFDHIAVPSRFASNSLGEIPSSVLPHGYDPNVFYPRERSDRNICHFPRGTKHAVGVVATNQRRKDWGMVAEVCGELHRKSKDIRFWWHTDSMDCSWNLSLLIQEFGLTGFVTVTNNANDEALAEAYSQCDVTLAPGLGEGFGYPILESIACGTPVIHGAYGAGAEIIERCGFGRVIQPITLRWDNVAFPTFRPVYGPAEWFDAAMEIIAWKVKFTWERDTSAYSWDVLMPRWEHWFEAGLAKHVRANETVSIETAGN